MDIHKRIGLWIETKKWILHKNEDFSLKLLNYSLLEDILSIILLPTLLMKGLSVKNESNKEKCCYTKSVGRVGGRSD